MMRMLFRKLGYLKVRGHKPRQEAGGSPSGGALSRSLQINLKAIRETMGTTTELVVREVLSDADSEQAAAIIYMDGLVDQSLINENILKPLFARKGRIGSALDMAELASNVFTVGNLSEIHDSHTLIACLLEGNTVFLADHVPMGLALDTASNEKRGVGQPTSEVVVRGPQRAFIEDIKTNMSLLRQVIRNKDLIFRQMLVGQRSRTKVCVCYIRGLASDGLVKELTERIHGIDTDGILASGYVEQFIDENPFSPFATISYTERPDVVAAKLLEGRAAILVDGTPNALTAPALFVEWFQAPDDYAAHPYFATMVRWFRYISFFLSISSPALYVALTAFHQELLPTPLLITVAASREGTPFPVILEVILMGLIFEILREAGLRMPRQYGQSVSIVGALVIGQAAISSGLVGGPVVMVVSITAITAFAVPSLSEVGTFLRLVFVLLSGTMGIIGFSFGLVYVLIHLACLRSFGVPYLSPLAPLSIKGLGDSLVRLPLWSMQTRPKFLGDENPIRRGNSSQPTQNPGRQHEDNS